MENALFIELSAIILAALVFSGIMHSFKQPLMIGFILAGVLLSPQLFDIVNHSETIETFSHIGISLLLFMVGLHLNPKSIKNTGNVTLFAGIGQMILTALAGYLACITLGFDSITAIYISIALSLSSTIIVMKLLSDMKDSSTLFGRIATGVLILQDHAAMLILLIIAAAGKSGGSVEAMIISIIWGIAAVILLYIISEKTLPYITKKAAASQEILLLFSLGWCLFFSSAFHFFDLTMETGALLAGITLSMSPFKYEIHAKLRPLRDFFVMLFYVYLGSQLSFQNIQTYAIPIIVVSIFILVIKPMFLMAIMGIMGYTKKNSFKTAISLAQIGEFSFKVVAIGAALGHLKSDIVTFITIVGVITMIGSTYFMIYSEKLFEVLNKYLDVFERQGHKVDQHIKHSGEKHDVILLGFSKMGSEIVKGFIETKKRFLVVDFDPKNIFNLSRQGIDCRYGDISNAELFEELNFDNVKMVVSTIKDFDTNLLLINKIRNINTKCIIMVMSHQGDEALRLYEEGADYVIMPNYIGGFHTSGMIADFGFEMEKFMHQKSNHVKQLLINKEINFGKN